MSNSEKAEVAFVAALDNVEEALAVREKLTMQLKKGFFELSQARYSMGSGNVGELKYKPDTEPTVGINMTLPLIAELAKLSANVTRAVEKYNEIKSSGERQREDST